MQLTGPFLLLAAAVQVSCALPGASFEIQTLARRAPMLGSEKIAGVFERFRPSRQPGLETQMSTTPAFRAEEGHGHEGHIHDGQVPLGNTPSHHPEGTIPFARQTTLNDEALTGGSRWSRLKGRFTRPRPETVTLGADAPLHRDPIPYDVHAQAVRRAGKKGLLIGAGAVGATSGTLAGVGYGYYKLTEWSNKRNAQQEGRPDNTRPTIP